MMNIENTRTWIRYHEKLCKTCRAGCCTFIVEVSGADLIRLGLTDEWEMEHSMKKLIQRLKKEGIIKRYHFKTGIFVLEQNSRGDCIFLDSNRKCRVYEKRPLVCRKHPAEVGPRPGYCAYSPA
ncbi:MAG: YkgJ family cysteine cluster protein [Desulfobacteraceae bacterium]|nr:MAG: YkgJ family cysteine cluster protein [Desulfobacteraceae bacterium]